MGSVQRVRTLLRPMVALALLAGACGSGDTTAAPAGGASSTTAVGGTAPPEGAGPAPAPGAPAPVPEALRFTAPALDGGQVVGADYAGRDVAMWFWAPW